MFIYIITFITRARFVTAEWRARPKGQAIQAWGEHEHMCIFIHDSVSLGTE